MLLDSELDVALVEGTVTSKDLISKPVYQDKLIMVVGKGHKFYNRDEISIEELQGEAIILVKREVEVKQFLIIF